MPSWIVKRGSLERTVTDTATLFDLAQARRLKPTDLVFHPDRNEWLPASDVPEIRRAFEEESVVQASGDSRAPTQERDSANAVLHPTRESALDEDAQWAGDPGGEAEAALLDLPAIGEREKTMKGFLSVIIAALLFLCVALLAWPLIKPAAHTQALTQWEYKIVAIPDAVFEVAMNKLGEDGWELVFARRASDGSSYSPQFSYEVIVKRPKQASDAK